VTGNSNGRKKFVRTKTYQPEDDVDADPKKAERSSRKNPSNKTGKSIKSMQYPDDDPACRSPQPKKCTVHNIGAHKKASLIARRTEQRTMSYKPKEPFARNASFSQEQEFTRVDAGDSFEDEEWPKKIPSFAKNKIKATQSNELADNYGKKR
jgi:hypothetical protein